MTTTTSIPLDAVETDIGAALAGVGDRPARILTGDRPTGDLHLGHYLGTVRNRIELQRAGADLMIVVADYQVMTDRDEIGPLRTRVLSLVADYLACGVDPQRAAIFPHSAVTEIHQLLLPFLSLVSDAELRRNPTVKAELASSGRPLSGLLLTYPVHQAADILFSGADLVPVGHDQLPHLELTRTIARRFNDRYGPVFRQPRALLSEVPLLLGTDGRKMSKSRGNTVPLGATDDETAAVLRRAVTDSDPTITYDPDGRPGVAALLQMTAGCTGVDPVAIADGLGAAGSARLKQLTIEAVNECLRPIRARRRELVDDPVTLRGVLLDGTVAASTLARATLTRVRAAMDMDHLRNLGER